MTKNPNNKLNGKKVLLAISGGIAAYKAPELVRRLIKAGAQVTCVATENALKFVTTLTLETVSKSRIYTDIFEPHEFDVEHIALSKASDIVVVVPATADTLAKLACGRAEDLLSSVVLSTKKPVLLCPSMNENMWLHPATKRNIKTLQEYNYNFVMPQKGELACGDNGEGRLADLDLIVEKIENLLT